MSNVVATQILVDGARNAVVKVTGVLDTSDVSMVAVVTPSDFTPTPTAFRIDRVTYSVEQGLAVRLWWDASTDLLIHSFTQSETGCWEGFGGLINNAGTGVTGDINLTTTGHTSGDNYTIILEMVKE